MNAIFDRCSIRQYKQQPLKKEEIQLILKAAFCAPSASNKQPWFFIVVNDKNKLEKMSTFTPYATPLKKAAMGIVVCTDLNCNQYIDYGQQDCAAATQNMLLEAHELGIGSCWIGFYPHQDRVEKLKNYFQLEENIVPLWAVAFGYMDEAPNIKNKWKEEKIRYE